MRVGVRVRVRVRVRGQQPHEQREGPHQFRHVVARAGARRLERLEQLVRDLVRVRVSIGLGLESG